MSTPTPPPRVFVAQAREDTAWCRAFVETLRQGGADVWYDEHDPGRGVPGESADEIGDERADEVARELAARPTFAVVLSPAAVDDPWVRRAMDAASGPRDTAPERSLLVVMAAAIPESAIPRRWRAYERLAGPGGAPLPPTEAGARVLRRLLTAPGGQPRAPRGVGTGHPDPAPAPPDAQPALPLTPPGLYDLGFRGWKTVQGVECVLPPLCQVPGGVFTMGGDTARDRDAHDDEMPPSPVTVEDRALARHPVTVCEYACFVRDGGAEPPRREFAGQLIDWPTQRRRPDHPVVCVSWREATAYAVWLASLTGHAWRLPTEAEWEKAARGTDGRVYPWGDAFDAARCNTNASSIGTTTPVGTYPSGASPCGAQDLAGNVWEWTSSLYRPYPYVAADGREAPVGAGRRVLRGGCWYGRPHEARAAYRYHGNPLSAYLLYGFRLVLAGPGS